MLETLAQAELRHLENLPDSASTLMCQETKDEAVFFRKRSLSAHLVTQSTERCRGRVILHIRGHSKTGVAPLV